MTVVTSRTGRSATPLLDRERPLPARSRRGAGRAMVPAIVAGFAGVFLFRFSRDAGFVPAAMLDGLLQRIAPPDGNWLPVLLLLPLSILFAIIVHEAGHALAGRAAGFRLATFAIGPLALIRSGSRFTVRAAERDVLLGSASFDMIPDRGLRRGLAAMYAAGPGANVVTAVIAFALVGSGAVTNPGWLVGCLGFLAVISILLSFELLPFRTAGHESDGSRVLMLLRDRQRLRSWLSLMALQRELDRGRRPRDLPLGWLQAARSAPRDSRDFVHAELMAYVAAADRDDVAAAAEHLERCLSLTGSAPPELARILPVEAAIFQGWYRRDAEKAAAWMQDAGEPASLPIMLRLRFEVAMARASGSTEDMVRAWERGLRVLEDLPDGPQKTAWIAAWRAGRAELDAEGRMVDERQDYSN